MSELLEADYQIRQLHARFVDAAWRKDGDSYAQLFTEDGEWKLAKMHMRGRKEIGESFTRLLGYTNRVLILPGVPILELEGNTALSRSYCTEFTKMPDGRATMALGTYFDRYEKTGGAWLFKWRHYNLKYSGPIDYSDELVDSPDFGAFPGMPEPDAPTYTRLKQS